MSAAEVSADITQFQARFAVLPDNALILNAWHSLVDRYEILGKKAHDARLVATMICHDVTHLLTFNTQDFARFSEVTAIFPASEINIPRA